MTAPPVQRRRAGFTAASRACHPAAVALRAHARQARRTSWPSNRRTLIAGLAAAGTLPRFAIAQADTRPSVTVAVQIIAISGTLEPMREQSNVGFRIMPSFSEPLIGIDWLETERAQPMLATAWRRIDGRTLELSLRENVVMHDGRTMTAEDVAFTFSRERMWTGLAADSRGLFVSTTAGQSGKTPPPEAVAISRAHYPGFERMEVVDAKTVRFVNSVPDVTLEGRLTRTTGAIFSRAAFDAAPSWLDWARKPVGTGPYRIVEHRPGRDLLLEAHDAYWGGRPPLKSIRFVEVPDVASRVAGLMAGDWDFICDLPPDQIGGVERSARHQVVGGPINNIRIIVWDKTHPVLANPLVRRAMSHSIDRQAIVDSLWSGRTAVPRGMQWEVYGDMMLRDWEAPRFDMAEARRLLREANYRGEPIPYQLLNNYYTGQVASSQVLVEGWRAAGLNVQIEMKENWGQILGRFPGPRAVRQFQHRHLQRPGGADVGLWPGRADLGERPVAERGIAPASRCAADRGGSREAAHHLPPAPDADRARGPRLYGAVPDGELHRQAARPAVARVEILRDGFLGAQLGRGRLIAVSTRSAPARARCAPAAPNPRRRSAGRPRRRGSRACSRWRP